MMPTLTDADYAAIVKRYEDAGDVQNADIIRRQWTVARGGGDAHPKPAETRMDTVSHGGADQVHARQGDPLITVRFSDLMALARQIIAEQLDDCEEEFVAGRAHGVGSFHSEILELSKRTALAEAQDAPKSAGASANRHVRADLVEEVLATVLWLYRRLPRGYGRPPTVERPIMALAKLTGIDVADCLAERGPGPKASSGNEGGNDGP